MAFNYPIKVLKKKFKTEGYKPFILDTSNGNVADLPSPKGRERLITLTRLSTVILSLLIFYGVVLSPVVETIKANTQANMVLSTLGPEEAALMKKLKYEQGVVSQNKEGDLITVTVLNRAGEIRNILDIAFKFKGVKEVYTDGQHVVITFMSSGI